jgi:hypothetical protein
MGSPTEFKISRWVSRRGDQPKGGRAKEGEKDWFDGERGLSKREEKKNDEIHDVV